MYYAGGANDNNIIMNEASLVRYFIKSTKYNFPHNEIIIPPHEMEIMIKRNVKPKTVSS